MQGHATLATEQKIVAATDAFGPISRPRGQLFAMQFFQDFFLSLTNYVIGVEP